MIEETPIIKLAGELDLSNVGELRRALDSVAQAELVVIDMSAVEFMDSTALAALVRYRKEAAARGTALALVIVSPLMHRLFELTNFDREFAIFRRLEDVPGVISEA